MASSNDQRWKNARFVKNAISRIRTKAATEATAPMPIATPHSPTTRRSTTEVSAGTCAAWLTKSSEGEIVSPPVVAELRVVLLIHRWIFSLGEPARRSATEPSTGT